MIRIKHILDMFLEKNSNSDNQPITKKNILIFMSERMFSGFNLMIYVMITGKLHLCFYSSPGRFFINYYSAVEYLLLNDHDE